MFELVEFSLVLFVLAYNHTHIVGKWGKERERERGRERASEGGREQGIGPGRGRQVA